MNASFNVADFVKSVGDDLVRDFDKARKTTTPGSVGSAMESAVQKRLNQLLPRGIKVGSGYITDSFGDTSRQMDIVLYEVDICPTFSVNDSPDSTYYPCEGVLAVGEVKSRIGKKELEDGFSKIRSAKRLRRAYRETGDPRSSAYFGRPYGDPGGQTTYEFDLENTNIGDIFGFIVGGKSTVKIAPSGKSSSSLLSHYKTNVESTGWDMLCPDIMVLLDGITIEPKLSSLEANLREQRYIPTRSQPSLPHVMGFKEVPSPFADLIISVWEHYENGLTARIPVSRYMRYYEQAPVKQEYAFTPIINCNEIVEQFKAGTITEDEVLRRTRTPVGHLQHRIRPGVRYRSSRQGSNE